ncbi:muconolactone Delta-isomerase family protein [Pseudenhygromyxa sp. WMMC2535]|uniref:muconolactone Delta-isomerase n=1 Tax=Pseudenhygromyxa sp. WMMC2535 TaxID=2712867 RepID=UPI0031F9A017
MLYLAHMRVNPPHPATEDFLERKAQEKQMALELQREGKWPHLWRVVGEYSNYSVFEVADHDELHAILSKLPLFPYLEITVTPLATHPSSLAANP